MTSCLYRELSKEELTELVSKSLHTDICFAKLLTGGLFNTTYYIDTAQCGAVVLRVGPVNRRLLLPYENNLMRAEQCVYELCQAAGVPVSEVLAADTSKKIIDRDYMIVRYIPSLPMSEAVLSADANSRICRDIGAAAAKLHSIKQSCFGRIEDVRNGKGFSEWSDCLLHEFEQWEAAERSIQLFSEPEKLRIKRMIENAAPILDEIKTPSLVHTDLWKGNILIRSDLKEFAAIIDADRAMWGDPELEFSSIEWTYSEPTFWEGYGHMVSDDFSGRIRREIYTLLWSLLNSYVYMREYRQPQKAFSERLRALSCIERLSGLE